MKELFTNEFWESAYDSLKDWLITEFPAIVITIVVFIIAVRIIRFFIGKTEKVVLKKIQRGDDADEIESQKRVNTLFGILKGTVSIILWAIFLIILLGKLGLDIGPLIAGAGIAGLAIGFGAQEIVRDFFNGFFMLLENQIRVGDVAIINGTGGLVEKIEMRTTTLRDFSGIVHIFQNGKVNTLSNMTKEWSAMVFDVGVAYKENTDKVIEVMKRVGAELRNDPEFGPKIIEDLEVFGVDQFGDSSVIIKARFKTKPIQQWNVGREFKGRLKKAFDSEGIEIPFPHLSLYFGEASNPIAVQNINQ